MNFLNPAENDPFDITSLFMMQLACIVNMVNVWSKLKMRICVCDETRQASFSINSSVQSRTERLQSMLKNLRIQAEICHMNSWKTLIDAHYQNSDDYFMGYVTKILIHCSYFVMIFFFTE